MTEAGDEKRPAGTVAAEVIAGATMLIEAGLQKADAPAWLMIGTGLIALVLFAIRKVLLRSRILFGVAFVSLYVFVSMAAYLTL